MEKHRCKLCFKNFSNGRALGGHMRSHMMNLPIPPKPEEDEEAPPPSPMESASSASSSSSDDDDEQDDLDKNLSYGLRENPKKSIRFVDPEFSFAGSVILQDRESETESSKNPTRLRSKRTRTRKSITFEHHELQQQRGLVQEQKLIKFNSKLSKTESEPVSSISDATTEEDVAFCLILLSRDKWMKEKNFSREFEDDEEDEDEETEESEEMKSGRNRNRGKYKCETCKKVFKSYQALGGHRASHKKIRISAEENELEKKEKNAVAGASSSASMAARKIHECPVCFRVFSSGQALGGHKRSHVTGSAAAPATALPRSSTKFGDSLIDLNLPAPIDEDDISQIEVSALSDAADVCPLNFGY